MGDPSDTMGGGASEALGGLTFEVSAGSMTLTPPPRASMAGGLEGHVNRVNRLLTYKASMPFVLLLFAPLRGKTFFYENTVGMEPYSTPPRQSASCLAGCWRKEPVLETECPPPGSCGKQSFRNKNK